VFRARLARLVRLVTVVSKVNRVSPEIKVPRDRLDRKATRDAQDRLDLLVSRASKEVVDLLETLDLRVVKGPSEHQVGGTCCLVVLIFRILID